MVDVKETLLRLVGEVQDCGCDVTDVVEMNYVENQVLIDHLIANGVTIPVRCKDCTYWKNAKVNKKGFLICPASGMEITEEDYCSYGERRIDGSNQ